MAARVMIATWQEDGPAACFRKVRAAAAMHAPVAVRRRRTARSVGAYFDLITDDEYEAGLARAERELPQQVEYRVEWLLAIAQLS